MIWIKISSHTAYLNIHIHVQTARRCILNTFKNTNTFDHEYLFSYTCPSNFKTTLIRLNLNQSRNIISWKSIKYWIIILTVKPLWLTQYLSIIYERIYQQNAKPWHRRVQICQKFLQHRLQVINGEVEVYFYWCLNTVNTFPPPLISSTPILYL